MLYFVLDLILEIRVMWPFVHLLRFVHSKHQLSVYEHANH